MNNESSKSDADQDSGLLTLAQVKKQVEQLPARPAPAASLAVRPKTLTRRFETENDADDTVDTWIETWSDPVGNLDEKKREELISSAISTTLKLQYTANRRDGYRPAHRGFQAKSLYGSTEAQLLVTDNLPAKIAGHGFLEPGAGHRAIVRFSSAYPAIRADGELDQRSVAVRVVGDADQKHDLTLTSGSGGNHARDAKAFIASIQGAEIRFLYTYTGLVRGFWNLVKTVGLTDALRMIWDIRASQTRGHSLAAHYFYSRAPFRLGTYAVKYRLAPAPNIDPWLCGRGGRDALLRDLVARQRVGDIRYRLQLQGYVHHKTTPMDDHRVDWPAADSPWVTVAELVLPRVSVAKEAAAHEVTWKVSNRLAFSPFNRWDDDFLEPLGELNMLRNEVYKMSAMKSCRGGADASGCPLTPTLRDPGEKMKSRRKSAKEDQRVQ